MRRSRGGLLAAVAGAAVTAGIFSLTAGSALFSPAAQAQNLGDRTVSGTVSNTEAAPVVNATVFLKNQKTKTIRSYSTTPDGHFHFAQVNMAEDFDLWAEKDGHKSAVKTVSSWDARKDYISDLKLK